MFEFAIGFAIFVAVMIVLSICKFFSETNQELKEKKRYDFEQKKKQDEFALEAQRKQVEQELEFRKQAGLDPIYQEQTRKNKQYKAVIVSLIALIIFIGGYILFSNNESAVEAGDGALSIAEKITDSSQEETLISQKNEKLPERFTPSQSNNLEAQSNNSQEVEPIIIQNEATQKAVSNPFEGDQNDKNIVIPKLMSVYEAYSHIGKNTTVCGEISQISQTSKATYINFGGRYPKQKFSAVIWSNTIMPPSEGRNICITGLIESYKGVPQIVISSIENQISDY